MKLKLSKSLQLLFVVLLLVSLLTNCSNSNDKKPQSMAQIQKENGMPVEVQKIKTQNFESSLIFYGKFRGEKQTVIGAMIGGRVDIITVNVGDKVKKNQVIIKFPNDAPASQIQQAKAAFENSRKTYKRMKALLAKGEVAQAQFDGAKTKYLVDKRNFETLKQTLHLDAPYDGTITEIMVHEGDNVKKKSPLFTVAKLNKMKIRIWLNENERMQIKIGMKVFATVGKNTFTGKVQSVSLSEDPFKQAFYADLIFNNSSRKILSGTTANIKIITYANPNAIVIPKNLVKKDNHGFYVYIAKGNKAVKQNVFVTNLSGVNYEIGSGVKVGDLLIVKGNARLTNGIKIKVVK